MKLILSLTQKQKIIILIASVSIVVISGFLAINHFIFKSKQNASFKKYSASPTKMATPSATITSILLSPTRTVSVIAYKPSATPTPTGVKATSTPVPPTTSTPTPVQYQDTNGPSFGALLPPGNIPNSFNDVCLKVYDIKDNDSTLDQIYIQFSLDGSISGLSKNVEKCYNDLSNGHHTGWISVTDKWGNVTTMNVSFEIQVSSPTDSPTNTPAPSNTPPPTNTPSPIPEPTT